VADELFGVLDPADKRLEAVSSLVCGCLKPWPAFLAALTAPSWLTS